MSLRNDLRTDMRPGTPSAQYPNSWSAPLRFLVRLISGAVDHPADLDEESWAEFVALAVERHRVAPAVLDAAREAGIALPPHVTAVLSAESVANATAMLQQKAESVRILRELGAAGCRPAILKGWPLAETLYRLSASRHAKDLDIYVETVQIGTAISGLLRLGYEVEDVHAARVPVMSDPAFQFEFNDLSFVNPERGVQVELHWRSYHFRGWPDLGDIPDALVEIPVDGTGVTARVPSQTANLIYLSLHGQQHLWLRLKWLLDIRRQLMVRSSAEISSDLAVANGVGAGRAVTTAVNLAAGVLGAPLPEGWPALDLSGKRAIRRFLHMIGDPDSAPGTFNARFQFYWTSLWMAESLSQRLGVLRYGLWRRLRFMTACKSTVGQ